MGSGWGLRLLVVSPLTMHTGAGFKSRLAISGSGRKAGLFVTIPHAIPAACNEFSHGPMPSKGRVWRQRLSDYTAGNRSPSRSNSASPGATSNPSLINAAAPWDTTGRMSSNARVCLTSAFSSAFSAWAMSGAVSASVPSRSNNTVRILVTAWGLGDVIDVHPATQPVLPRERVVMHADEFLH